MKVIGIDLGTTNSCVAVTENGKPVIIENAEGNRTTPSVISIAKNGERIVGEAAKRQSIINAENTVYSIKRDMGTNRVRKLNGYSYKPQQISAMILSKLKADAEKFLGEEVTEAVITVPAYFDDAQRQATKDTGRIAGLNVKRIINEPTAAALAYGLDRKKEQKIMVYDLGGGTFDVSIIETADGMTKVLATAGDTHLGGDDFDKKIMDWMLGSFRKTEGIDLSGDAMAMQRFKDAAEKAKKELSSSLTATIGLPFITANEFDPKHFEAQLTRRDFEGMIRGLVNKTEVPVQTALNDAGLSKNDIDEVLLVGGSTRIPLVRETVKRITGKEPRMSLNPDECVALGAAVQAGKLSGDFALSDVLLLDVTPLTLSIEADGGLVSPIIPRNTTIPASGSSLFTTVTDNQQSAEIAVYQGERPLAKDNRLLGSFFLYGITPNKKGVPVIEVSFDIDADGIVTVSAQEQGTGKKQSIRITGSSNMSENEIKEAIAKAEKYRKEDRERKRKIEVRNEAEAVMLRAENAGKSHCDKSCESILMWIENDIQKIKPVLERTEGLSDIPYTDAKLLETYSERISQNLARLC